MVTQLNAVVSGSAGAWVLEQLSLQLPGIEMATARRAWHDARSAWPGGENRLWWKWLVEAAGSIGLSARVVDCSLNEVMTLIRSGAQVFAWRPDPDAADGDDGFWVGVSECRRRRAIVLSVGKTAEREEEPLRSVHRRLAECEQDGRLRCVVIRNDLRQVDEDAVGLKPFARLRALLRPEWTDIWVVVVFAFVVGILTLATPLAVESLVNTVAFGRFLQPIVVLAIIVLIFLSFSSAIKALQTYVAELVQRRLFARIAGDLAWRLPRVTTEGTDGRFLPELTNRFFDIVTVQKVAAQFLLDGVSLVLSTLVGMAVLAFYHPWLLGFDLVMMAAIAFIIVVLGHGAVKSAVKESKNKYNMAAWLEDIARNPATFRSAGGADLAIERADRLVHEYLEARGKHFGILMRQVVFALGLQALASTVLLGLGGWLVVSGQLTLGQLVAAELIVTVIVGAFAKFGKHMESFYDLLASVDKLGALFDLPTERQGGLLDMAVTGPARVDVHNTAYRSKNGPHLGTPVSFTVKPGGAVAVFGRCGSGKSVLTDILAGLRSPTDGQLRIDGMDPMDVRPDVLSEHVSLARGPQVFAGTVEENVHLHRPDVSASDVRKALESVGLFEAVLNLEGGVETQLLSDGRPLSSVQSTLLTLARAIAGRPRLLLIDGLLDGLPDDVVDYVLAAVTDRGRPWTVIATTGRRTIAERFESTVSLSPMQPEKSADDRQTREFMS